MARKCVFYKYKTIEAIAWTLLNIGKSRLERKSAGATPHEDRYWEGSLFPLTSSEMLDTFPSPREPRHIACAQGLLGPAVPGQRQS